MSNQKIGHLIKKYRKEKGLTQQQLADKINKHKITITKYENATITNIPYNVIGEIAKALNIPIEYLLFEEKRSDDSDYKFNAFKEFMGAMGYSIEKFNLYLEEKEEWENAITLEAEKKYIELTSADFNSLFSDIEKYIEFSISKISSSEEFIDNDIATRIENDIDEYYNDEFIESIKEKNGYYGDNYSKPLNIAEKIVWEAWKENNKK